MRSQSAKPVAIPVVTVSMRCVCDGSGAVMRARKESPWFRRLASYPQNLWMMLWISERKDGGPYAALSCPKFRHIDFRWRERRPPCPGARGGTLQAGPSRLVGGAWCNPVQASPRVRPAWRHEHGGQSVLAATQERLMLGRSSLSSPGCSAVGMAERPVHLASLMQAGHIGPSCYAMRHGLVLAFHFQALCQ